MRVLIALLTVVVALISPAHADKIKAIEYFHAEFSHYFITASPQEVAILDAGAAIKGWKRTGEWFYVEDRSGPGLSPVCRFFSTAFGPKSSHFYTASASECAAVKANPDWQYEGNVFYVYEPQLAPGRACPVDTSFVYRLYNNGQGGAQNHRFVADGSIADAMIRKGWVEEGFTIFGMIFCGPNHLFADDGTDPFKDPTTPVRPKNLTAKSGFSVVYLEWEFDGGYRNHQYTEIWRAKEDRRASATPVGTSNATGYADPAEPATTYYYWIRFVSMSGIEGPYNSESGTIARTPFSP